MNVTRTTDRGSENRPGRHEVAASYLQPLIAVFIKTEIPVEEQTEPA